MYNFDNIKAYVLRLGQFEETDKLDLQIQMIIDEALAYCYRKDIPPNMELPLVDVIVNEIQRAELTGLDAEVSTYREGDMNISFSTSNTLIGKPKYNGKLEGFKQIIGAIRCSETTDAQ